MRTTKTPIISPTKTVWKPHVTVAAVIEQNQCFLTVEERIDEQHLFNQPAGHLEPNEDLISAIKREVLEETAWTFEPDFLIGVQLWQQQKTARTYLRFCFGGRTLSHDPQRPLDAEIVQTHWFSYREISARRDRLRSPLVLIGIEQYLNGVRYPLAALQAYFDHD